METKSHTPNPVGLEVASVLFGFAAGILGTLIFATYKQKSFDKILDKSRSVAGQTNEFFEDLESNARNAGVEMTQNAHRAISQADHNARQAIMSADHSAHRAIDSVEKAIKG